MNTLGDIDNCSMCTSIAIVAASALKVVADSEVAQYEKEVAELEIQLVE